MLPLDLLRYRIQEDAVCPRYVNPQSRRYRAIAKDLIAIYAAHPVSYTHLTLPTIYSV